MTIIGPGSWVRCVRQTPLTSIVEGRIYKVFSVHTMQEPCNGPDDHQCRQIALVLEGVAYPYCSQCFVPIRPGGPGFLETLLKVPAPTKGHNNGPA